MLIKLKKKLNFFRSIKFLRHKVVRIRDLPESIAIGLAWGAAVSFTPLIGLHILICFLGTFLMRGNILAAAAGTVIGNPWTFPVFFYVAYNIGILFYNNEINNYDISISFLVENFEELFVPTLIGSIPLSILAWITIYKTSKFLLEKNKKKWLKEK